VHIDGQVTYNLNYTISANSSQLISNTITTIYWLAAVPCYGSLDWYMAFNRDPTPTDNDAVNENVQSSDFYATKILPPSTVQANSLFVAKSNYASFDFITYPDTVPVISFVPTPFSKIITGSLHPTLGNGTLTWTATNDATDTYELYYSYSKNVTDGYNIRTACSVRSWMTRATSDKANITISGSTCTAQLHNFDRTKPVQFAVVVRAQAAYSSVYNPISFNATIPTTTTTTTTMASSTSTTTSTTASVTSTTASSTTATTTSSITTTSQSTSNAVLGAAVSVIVVVCALLLVFV
jgi:hypothetical protein